MAPMINSQVMPFSKFSLSLRAVANLLHILTALSFIMIVLGGTVRVANAGLSCPDWPLCYGQLVPLFDTQIFLEWFHRLIAGGISILFLVVFVSTYKTPLLRQHIGKAMVVATLLLLTQIVLGGLTVLLLLKHQVVVGHLATGYAFFSANLYMFLTVQNLRRQEGKAEHSGMYWRETDAGKKVFLLAKVSMVLVALQIVFGGLVSSNYAGLACLDFPQCRAGQWFPESFYTASGLHSWHRIWAMAIGSYLFISVVLVLVVFQLPKTVRWLFRAQFLVFLFQFLVGLGMVLMNLPTAMRITHAAAALTLYTLCLVTTHALYFYRLPKTH